MNSKGLVLGYGWKDKEILGIINSLLLENNQIPGRKLYILLLCLVFFEFTISNVKQKRGVLRRLFEMGEFQIQ